MTYRLPP